jgi:hypothetical protein
MMSTHELHDNNWRTSSYTTGNGNCVEVNSASPEVQVRDTKDRTGGTLSMSASLWRAFVSEVRR